MKTQLLNVWEHLGENDSFINNYENALRFKGKSWESLDENHKKEVTTTNNTILNLRVLLGVCRYVCGKV